MSFTSFQMLRSLFALMLTSGLLISPLPGHWTSAIWQSWTTESDISVTLSSPHIPPSPLSFSYPSPDLTHPRGCFLCLPLGYTETSAKIIQQCHSGRGLWLLMTSLRTRTMSGSLLYPRGRAHRTPSSILAWRIPWTEESMGCKE